MLKGVGGHTKLTTPLKMTKFSPVSTGGGGGRDAKCFGSAILPFYSPPSQ